ncbi:asparagine synthase (glutamine-hydrolysing) [Chryseobacterium soldanellicola]|uniref:asparagine synthase (glutamine-hydrolyzing) n=1 Tax=Chryseobacterium soldanellicola TaxID=311333 RepID=A0A1H1DAW8_9FLAO|nr:asparagine synthase (glutamine-hydrolyzing) [Chryseobacterium soldanellicola]SDQ73358.1 asparagine synthase (glutamine-hydrolysing) [Chryseobacterium soldanellicola]
MCGIAGIIYKDGTFATKETLKKMTDKMSHRGPDAEGFFVKENIGLGHRRLSIIDVSESANQPFFYGESNVLVFNGAIYNYLELKKELEDNNYSFRTSSDTEVLIAAYDFWGEQCVGKFNGMWSFVIFDAKKNKLFCSRDRFGVKPFYYYFNDNKFVFASEIKPILEIEKVEEVNINILLEYLVVNMSEQSEDTFFKGIKKLLGSHNLTYNLDDHKIEIYKYYEIPYKKEINDLSLDESIKLFEKEFENSVKLRLRSDVKIGSALSGGLDSSYIASVATDLLSKNSKGIDNFTAITVGSVDKSNDESELSKITTKKLNINHDIIIPKSDEFKDSFEEVIFKHEEPFGGVSIYMQKFLMKEANKLGIKVLLDGQGADEILLGYSRYTAAFLKSHGIIKNIKFLSQVKTHYSISIVEAVKIYLYFSTFSVRKFWLKRRGKILKDKYFKIIDFSNVKNLTNSYNTIFELQKNEILRNQLPELLKWEDKNSMGYSIESRLPFLDYNFVETCLSININYKIRDGWSKYLLRRNLEKFLPNEITYNRKKIGFDAPVEDWWPKSEDIIETINNSKIIQKISKKKFNFIEDRDLEWRLYNIAVWEKLYNMKLES